MTEEWKPIPGALSYYASRDGRIARLVAGKFRLLKQGLRKGYRHVSVGSFGQRRVSRLILMTFVGPCPAGMEACHNNGVSDDNRIENLRWDTPTNNHADKKKHGTYQAGEGKPNAKLTLAQVLAIRADPRPHRVLAREYGISRGHIHNVKVAKKWKHISPEGTNG